MRPITIDRVVRVPREHLNDPMQTVQSLVLENGQWHAGLATNGKKSSVPRYFVLAEEDDLSNEVVLPRALDIRPHLRQGLVGRVPVHAEVLDETWWPRVWLGDGDPVLGPHKDMPYDQGPAWDAISAEPEWPWGRILALKCGGGKTVLGLKLARRRAGRTLIVCHTLNMSRTWSQTAAERWCLDYPAENHGFIGDGIVDWEGRDLVFSSMPGLLCREYPPEFWTRWKLVIFDEGDLMGASNMSKALPLFLGERFLVTATPTRADGNHILYRHHIGEVCFEDIEQDLHPECFVMDSPVPRMVPVVSKTGRKSYKSAEQMAWSSFYKKMTANIPKTISFLATQRERQDWAMSVVRDLLDDERKILFLGERVDELKLFHARAMEKWDDISSGLVLGATHMSVEESEENLRDCDIIWGIQQIAKRGLNEKRIDTIVIQYASFKDEGRLRQTVGRALRYHADKQKPYVIILNDANVPCLNSKSESMTGWLEGQGYEVSWYEYDEEKAA